jgi:hypothetical protein
VKIPQKHHEKAIIKIQHKNKKESSKRKLDAVARIT